MSHKYDSGFPAALSLSLFCIAFSIDGNVGFTHFYSNSTLKDLPLQYVQYKFLEQSIAKIGGIFLKYQIRHFSNSFSYNLNIKFAFIDFPPNSVLMYRLIVKQVKKILLISETKQVKKITFRVNFHVPDIVKTLRQKKNIQIFMMTIHGKELVKTLALTPAFQR